MLEEDGLMSIGGLLASLVGLALSATVLIALVFLRMGRYRTRPGCHQKRHVFPTFGMSRKARRPLRPSCGTVRAWRRSAFLFLDSVCLVKLGGSMMGS
jgi:hypothetical protein